jgi:hypothetical protein
VSSFVLIIVMSTFGGPSIASIPGYQTKALCEAAGSEWAERAQKGEYLCISGPMKESGQ